MNPRSADTWIPPRREEGAPPGILFFLLGTFLAMECRSDEAPATLPGPGGPVERRNCEAKWEGNVLALSGSPPAGPAAPRYTWASIPAPAEGWGLDRRETVSAEIANLGAGPIEVMLWVVGDRGWDAVPASAKLSPGEKRTVACKLRETYPDGTPKIDPGLVKEIRVMLAGRPSGDFSLSVGGLRATGSASAWAPPPGRLEVPVVSEDPPAPGSRVRFRLPDPGGDKVHAILGLPEDWEPGRLWPVIVEYPGNLFFTGDCFSTGLPEQCVIGYGITRGRGAITLGLPFVLPENQGIAEHGWGDPDVTADHALRFVEEVCRRYGGDRSNLVLTGFSRGAIACGYIGLRNERIAPLWKGFHACQHYDGDGWNGASLEGALERAKRFRGRKVFQTDNPPRQFQPVMDAMNAEVEWVQSGLGAHAIAMFLDDRPSTERLRSWYWALVKEP